MTDCFDKGYSKVVGGPKREICLYSIALSFPVQGREERESERGWELGAGARCGGWSARVSHCFWIHLLMPFSPRLCCSVGSIFQYSHSWRFAFGVPLFPLPVEDHRNPITGLLGPMIIIQSVLADLIIV